MLPGMDSMPSWSALCPAWTAWHDILNAYAPRRWECVALQPIFPRGIISIV